MSELNQQLYALLDKVRESQQIADEALAKVKGVVDNGHLRSTLTLLQSDIALRRLLDLQSKR